MKEFSGTQKCLDISFNQYPTDGAVADFLLSGITTILTATFVAAALHLSY